MREVQATARTLGLGVADTNHFRQSAQVYRHSKAKWPPGYSMANAMKVSEAREFVRH